MSGDRVAEKGHLDPTNAAFADVVFEVLRRGHSVRFRAKGSSMHPTIREGEAITVAPAQPAGIRRGDVILVRSARGVIAHRVVSVTRGADGSFAYVLRGDAATASDEPVEESAVLGRVVAAQRGGRIASLGGLRAETVGAARALVARFLRRVRAWLGVP